MKKSLILIVAIICFQVAFGSNFDIQKFSNPKKYGWETRKKQLLIRKNLIERQKLLQIYETKKLSPAKNVIKSAFVPGWGHFSAKRYLKGQILLGTEIILFGSSLYFYDQAMEKYDKYKKATYIRDIYTYYQEARSPYLRSQLMFGLGIAVWIYTIYDSITVTENYNRDLWQNIFFEYQNRKIKLDISPIGFSLRF
ncbi:MAG: hypothetical protein DRZ79_00325 [Candidatus Cloacimonadota bacterium]|nr:MAG: hypothetical protein DRZ79_00325 [Candidatus Cloacimonadota bacterium]